MKGHPADGDLAVVNAHLWDGTGREPAADQAIEVRGGRITRVERLGAWTPPRDLPRLDAEGRFVIPGLLDCHVHLVYAKFGSLAEVDQWPIEYHTLRAAENATSMSSGISPERSRAAKSARSARTSMTRSHPASSRGSRSILTR